MIGRRMSREEIIDKVYKLVSNRELAEIIVNAIYDDIYDEGYDDGCFDTNDTKEE